MPINWTSAQNFYGLKSPFNFKVALPFLLNTSALILVSLACVFLLCDGGLSTGTARFYFFTYIMCLLVIAAVFSKVSILSYMILCWCIVELGLALGSTILEKYGVGASLCPYNVVSEVDPDDYAFIYHPLLQIVPRPNWQYKDRLDWSDVEEKAKAARINLALQGQELTFVHNSLGIRGKELTADDLGKELIFVYGGSTTYDVGVTQGDTWVEQLQSDLNNKYTVLNFGVVAHSTAEHLIDTAFYQNVLGKRPVCSIYYVGWNDIINAHIAQLDSAYADYHLLTTAVRKPDMLFAKYSPLVFLVNSIAKKRFDSIPEHPIILGKTPVAGSDQRLEAIFIDHIKTITAINNSRGVRTIFIGQILNKDWPQDPNVWAPLVRTEDFLPLQRRFNSLLKDTTASIPAKYIDSGSTKFEDSDFVDLGHFTSSGARKFAALISKDVGAYCQ